MSPHFTITTKFLANSIRDGKGCPNAVAGRAGNLVPAICQKSGAKQSLRRVIACRLSTAAHHQGTQPRSSVATSRLCANDQEIPGARHSGRSPSTAHNNAGGFVENPQFTSKKQSRRRNSPEAKPLFRQLRSRSRHRHCLFAAQSAACAFAVRPETSCGCPRVSQLKVT